MLYLILIILFSYQRLILLLRLSKPNNLLPEFLFLFFKRLEFDRYAYFNAWSSTRETFNWDDMCNVKKPIPSIEKQKAIVNIHHVLEKRKKINEKLKNRLKSICPILMRGVVEGKVIYYE